MKIFLCRHGETEFNAENKWQGRVDSPLTQKGLAQVKNVARYLKHKKINAVFASPLGRAKSTAAIIKQHHPEASYSEHRVLKEIDNGDMDGLSIDETRKNWPLLSDILYRRVLDKRFPNGESYNDVKNRLKPFVKELIGGPWEMVLVVAHGGVNRMLLGLFLSISDKELVKVSTPNDVIYEIALSKDSIKIFNIKNGQKKEGLILSNV